MTNQEAFDRVVTHLRTQGEPAMNGLVCQYRASDGNKCAIGCLIPDDEYIEAYENNSIGALVRDYTIPSLQGLDIDFLTSLQGIHDKPHKGFNWLMGMEKEAARVALAYGLIIPTVD